MIKRFLLLSLALAWSFAVSGSPPASGAVALTPGVDYEIIEGGKPFDPLAGKIEVTEVFGYWCHVCAEFQPMVDRWKRKLPKDVRFTYVPLEASPGDQFARGYYAAQSTGVLASTHNAVFSAVHAQQALPKNPTANELAAFYTSRGANARAFNAAMQSATTTANVRRAREFAIRSKVPGTPTMIVNGKYRVLGRSLQDLLRITDALIARERAARR